MNQDEARAVHGGAEMSEPSAKARELVQRLLSSDRKFQGIIESTAGTASVELCRQVRDNDIAALLAYIASLELDAQSGWDAFYKLRKAVGEDRYPGLTNVVRCVDSARSAGQQGGE